MTNAHNPEPSSTNLVSKLRDALSRLTANGNEPALSEAEQVAVTFLQRRMLKQRELFGGTNDTHTSIGGAASVGVMEPKVQVPFLIPCLVCRSLV
jgi:hypothetical protein